MILKTNFSRGDRIQSLGSCQSLDSVQPLDRGPCRSGPRRWVLQALALLLLLSSHIAQGGNGPHNWLVVYDPGDPDSVAIARYYQEARGFPDSSMVAYSFPRLNAQAIRNWMTPDQGWELIQFLRNTIQERGLESQIHGITLTGSTSNAVRTNSPSSTSSISTALMMAPGMETQSDWETRTASWNQGWLPYGGGEPSEMRSDRLFEGEAYWLATHLGYTGWQGLRADEVFAMIDRSVEADGSFPVGTIYWPLNSDIRSTMRQGHPPLVADEWEELGIKAHVYGRTFSPGEFLVPEDKTGAPDSLPVEERVVRGAIVGAEVFELRSRPSLYVKGALAEHVTSFGGVMGTTLDLTQTTMAEWIRAGASGTSGTVTEPFATTTKFPNARLHSHYARGATMAEAFFFSLQRPWQTLFMGDGLTQPYAAIPEVQIASPGQGAVLSGSITLTVSVGEDVETESDLDLAINGRLIRMDDPSEPVQVNRVPGGFELDTTTLPDGWHELRVIAYGATPMRPQGFAVREVEIQNGSGSLVLEGPASATFGSEFAVTVSADHLADVSSIQIRSMGRVLATLGAGGGTADLSGSDLSYHSPSQLVAVALLPEGQEMWSAPLSVQGIWEPIPSQPEAAVLPGIIAVARIFPDVTSAGFDWDTAIPSAVVPVDDRHELTVEQHNVWPYLLGNAQQSGQTGGIEFVTRFFAPETGRYDFTLASRRTMGLVINGEEITGQVAHYRHPVALEAGWHELRFRAVIPTVANQRHVMPFQPAFRTHYSWRFHGNGFKQPEFEYFSLKHCAAPAAALMEAEKGIPRLAARPTGSGSVELFWSDPFDTETSWRIERFVGDPEVSLLEYLGENTPPELVPQGHPDSLRPLARVANDDPTDERFTMVQRLHQQGPRLLTARADRHNDGKDVLYRVHVPAGVTTYAILNGGVPGGEPPDWMLAAEGVWQLGPIAQPTRVWKGERIESEDSVRWDVYRASSRTEDRILELGGPRASSEGVPEAQAASFVFVKDGGQWEQLASRGANVTSATLSNLGEGPHRLRVVARMPPTAAIPSNEIVVALDGLEANAPPMVSAGLPMEVARIGSPVSLQGWALDDGLPLDGELTVTWSLAEGPAPVSFSDATSLETEATFSEPGVYLLQLLASDGELTAHDTVSIVVHPGATDNLAPEVDAGGAYEITTAQSIRLQGSATDDGLPVVPVGLLYRWTQVDGPTSAVFESVHKPDSWVYFPVAGTYVLQLTVSDGATSGMATTTFQVTQQPNSPPVVVFSSQGQEWIESIFTDAVLVETEVSDDGLPEPPGRLDLEWEILAGPGRVAAEYPVDGSRSLLAFDEPGEYTIRLSAHDGEFTVSDQVNVRVLDHARWRLIHAWGGNAEGQAGPFFDEGQTYLSQPTPVGRGWTQIHPDPKTTFALHNGAVLASGSAENLLFGDEDAEDRGYFAKVHDFDDVVDLAHAGATIAVLHADGTISTWGAGRSGSMGNSTWWVPHPDPVKVLELVENPPESGEFEYQELSGASEIFGFENSFFALDSEGNLRAWGNNSNGELGIGEFQSPTTAVPVETLSDVVQVAGGVWHSLFLLGDGSVRAAGYNPTGQFGRGDNTEEEYSNLPLPVLAPEPPHPPLSGIRHIAATNHSGFALDEEGGVWAWGANENGELGQGDRSHRVRPVRVTDPNSADGLLSGVIDLATGSHTVFALKEDGSVFAWGWGIPFPFGPASNGEDRLVPEPVDGLPPVVEIFAGGRTAFAATAWRAYEDFVSEHFTEQEVADGLADPSHEFRASGLPNLLAYALGRNPKLFDQPPAIRHRVEGGHIVFEADFLATGGDVDIQFMISDDLAEWRPAERAELEIRDFGDTGRAVLRSPLFTGEAPLFLRLDVRYAE